MSELTCPECDEPICATCEGLAWVDDSQDGTVRCPDCDERHTCPDE